MTGGRGRGVPECVREAAAVVADALREARSGGPDNPVDVMRPFTASYPTIKGGVGYGRQ